MLDNEANTAMACGCRCIFASSKHSTADSSSIRRIQKTSSNAVQVVRSSRSSGGVVVMNSPQVPQLTKKKRALVSLSPDSAGKKQTRSAVRCKQVFLVQTTRQASMFRRISKQTKLRQCNARCKRVPSGRERVGFGTGCLFGGVSRVLPKVDQSHQPTRVSSHASWRALALCFLVRKVPCCAFPLHFHTRLL